MVEKRGIGNRANIYFDSIDLEILELLNIPNRKTYEGGYSVIDIIEKLKINNKSLKPHIDKLLTLGLIHIIHMKYAGNDKGCCDAKKYDDKVGLTTISVNFKFLNDIDYYSSMGDTNAEDTYKKDKKEVEDFNVLLNFLRSIRKMYYLEDSKQKLDIDLRSKDTFAKFSKNIGEIDYTKKKPKTSKK